jgi:hypothetical protein
MNFNKPITSENDAEQFLYELFNEDLLFHPEDDPATIINNHNEYIFTGEECILINQRITEIYQHMIDPCKFIIEEFYPCVTDESRSYGPRI